VVDYQVRIWNFWKLDSVFFKKFAIDNPEIKEFIKKRGDFKDVTTKELTY